MLSLKPGMYPRSLDTRDAIPCRIIRIRLSGTALCKIAEADDRSKRNCALIRQMSTENQLGGAPRQPFQNASVFEQGCTDLSSKYNGRIWDFGTRRTRNRLANCLFAVPHQHRTSPPAVAEFSHFLCLSIASSSSSSDRGEMPSTRNPGKLSEAVVSICISST
jgi:hypothetical protein